MKTILLKFACPLQSWGSDSHFEIRGTDRYPTKSAVIGMISASLGYHRDEDEKISALNNLDFAVRIDQEGTILRDYHIARTENGEKSYVTYRYYLQDAVFVLAISSQDDGLITTIDCALKEPYYQVFLGRRSLPINADYYLRTTKVGPLKSLEQTSWKAASWYQKKVAKDGMAHLEIYADSDLVEAYPKHVKRDLVGSFSQKGRQHKFRSVSCVQMKVSAEHDAFEAAGGDYVHIKSRD